MAYIVSMRKIKLVLDSCLRGAYHASNEDELQEADSVIAFSFGTKEHGNGPGRVNSLLAEAALNLADEHSIPLIAQKEIKDHLYGLGRKPDYYIQGSPSTTDGSGIDSWSVLIKSIDAMSAKRPILVAQAHHIGRVAAQAYKLHMKPLLAPDMPQEFAPESEQWWTRSHGLWMVREIPGLAALKLQKKL